jgi:hypothetical protein
MRQARLRLTRMCVHVCDILIVRPPGYKVLRLTVYGDPRLEACVLRVYVPAAAAVQSLVVIVSASSNSRGMGTWWGFERM